MKRLTVTIDEQDYNYLRTRAAREQRSVPSLIRMAVDRLRSSEEFDATQDPMWAAGSIDGGPSDLSANVDAYLYR